MIKTDKHIKAIDLRDKFKKQINDKLDFEFNKHPNNPEKRVFPIYWDKWKRRLLNLEYYIIDCKYKVK